MKSKDLTPWEAIRLRNSVSNNKRHLREIRKEIKALEKERDVVLEELYLGDRIRIHRGRPYWSPYDDYETLDGSRRGSYRKRIDAYFNVQLDVGNKSGFFDGKKTILKVTEAQARKICLAWILDGVMP